MPDSQIEEIKRKVDIVQVIGDRVKLVKGGRNFKGLCPFHSEKTPSFMVSPELQIYKCFGCSKSGDVISFLEEFEGMEFVEALEYLANRAGVKLVRRAGGEEKSEREKYWEINHLAAEFYHYVLTSHKVGAEAGRYLKNRGLTNEAIEVFKLGYAPQSWQETQNFLVKKKGYKVEELEKVGLVIRSDKGSWYDRFRGRIMFPLTDARGRVAGFAGRVLDPEAKEAKYVNTPETEIYHKGELLYGLAVNKGEIKKQEFAVVVEGELDAIASWQAGVKNVVAIKGSAFTPEQIRLLLRYCRQARLALDADTAGQEATRRSIALADELGLGVRVVKISGGKDPDEIARADGAEWKDMVRQAAGAYDFYVRSALSRFDVKTGEGKRSVSQELAPVLAGMTNSVEQAHYMKVVAEALGVSEEAVAAEIEKAKIRSSGNQVIRSSGEEEKSPKTRLEVLEEYWLGCLLRAGAKTKQAAIERVKERKWEVVGIGRIVEYISQGSEVQQLPEELKSLAQTAWFKGETEDEQELARVEKEWDKVLAQKQLKALGEEIKRLEIEGGAREKLKELRQEFVRVAARLKSIKA